MNLYEFKDELRQIRKNRMEMKDHHQKLLEFEQEFLAKNAAGAMDYSKERVQSMPDSDGKMVSSIYRKQIKEEQENERIKNLPKENQQIIELMECMPGVEGSIMRLYVLHAVPMRKIAEKANYHRDTCYEKWNQACKKLWEVYENGKD